jgi:hypothetical protein
MKIKISRPHNEFPAKPVVGWRQLTVAAFFGVTLAACSGLGGVTKDSPEEAKVAAVTKQVEARWDALIAGDVQKSYSFLSAGSKASTSLDLYKAKARLSGFRAAKIEKIACGQEICKVSMQVTIDTKRMKGLPLPETETWILEGGEYRYVWLL